MKKIEVLITVLVLVVAFGGMYFLFTGAGLAGGNYVPVKVSGGVIEPSTFRIPSPGGVIGIINEGSSRVEVEILRGKPESAKIVWRNNVSPGATKTYAATRGNYIVRSFASMS